MTATAAETSMNHARQPADAVVERINDPTVAASLLLLLDHAELLATLVSGLSGFIGRSETIVDAVAGGVNDLKASGAMARPVDLPSLADMGSLAGQLSTLAPTLERVLASSMVRPEAIDLLSLMSEAAVDGAAAATAGDTRIGARQLLRALRDDDIQRGLGFLAELARSLGRNLQPVTS